METRCVSFRFRRALGCRGGKKRGTRLISGTTRARHDTRCADLKKSSFCASKKKRGKTYRRRRLARCCSSTSRHLSKWRERSSSVVAAAAPVASKMTMIPPFRGPILKRTP